MLPTDEHRALQGAVRDVLARRWDLDRYLAAGAGDDGSAAPGGALWRDLAVGLGLTGVAVPEAFGGAGACPSDLVLVHEETGRVLLDGPFWSTAALALPLLTSLHELVPAAEVAALVGGIVDGRRAATAVLPGHDAVPLEVVVEGDDPAVTGTLTPVVGVHAATDLLVVAGAGPDSVLLLLDPAAPGVQVRRLDGVDATRPAAEVVLVAAPATVLGRGPAVAAAADTARHAAGLALAAEQLGGAERVLEMTREHVLAREQFGRPLGSFQAVRHQLATSTVQLQVARAALWAAADVLRHGADPVAPVAAAQALCADTFLAVAEQGIHLHGALGFTAEHPVSLYYLRALASRAMLGLPRDHRRRITRHLVSTRRPS
jgi:alkylation response protein AidB-like acyl-CoA dehydrogenase